jgi:hypothetical protein
VFVFAHSFQISGSLSSLSACKRLKLLDTSGCKRVNGNLLHLEKCKALEYLNLTDCREVLFIHGILLNILLLDLHDRTSFFFACAVKK